MVFAQAYLSSGGSGGPGDRELHPAHFDCARAHNRNAVVLNAEQRHPEDSTAAKRDLQERAAGATGSVEVFVECGNAGRAGFTRFLSVRLVWLLMAGLDFFFFFFFYLAPPTDDNC